MFKIMILGFFLLHGLVSARVEKLDIRGVLDIAQVGREPFYLTRSGDIYSQGKDGFEKLELPERMIQVKSNGKELFMLREDGSVWSYNGKGVRLIDSKLPTLQMEVVGPRLYMLKRFGGLQSFEDGRIRMLLAGHRYEIMTASGLQLLMIDSWGRLFRYDTYAEFLEMIDSSPDNIQVVGADGAAFVLKKNGQAYKYQDLEFFPLNFENQVRTLATDGRWLWFVDSAANLYELNLAVESLSKVEVCQDPDFLRFSGESLYVGSRDGVLYQLRPSSRRHRVQVNFHRLWNPPIQLMRDGFKSP